MLFLGFVAFASLSVVGWLSEKLYLDGAYKFINYHVDVVQQGFDKEIQNIMLLIGG